MLESNFINPDTVAVLAYYGQSIIGFTYCVPKKKDKLTAHIDDTVIHPDFQGKKIVGLIMDVLEKTLLSHGYTYVSRDAAVSNGYADKIEKHYGSRILVKRDHDSMYGPQRYFKIQL